MSIVNKWNKMGNLNQKLGIGIASTILVFGIFFSYQVIFAKSPYKKVESNIISVNRDALSKLDNDLIQSLKLKVKTLEGYVEVDSINRQSLLKLTNEIIPTLELRIDSMDKYVESSQKNLDLWLKLLSFILTVLIGFSVYSGLKSRDLAKEELREIKETKDSINKQASDAEDRLKKVTEQLTEIEKTESKTKKIEGELTKKLEEFSSKEDIVLNVTQKKTIDDTIIQTKEELKKSGLDSFKNLYLAKSLKAFSENNWEEVIRLFSSYIDINETNQVAYYKRAYAFSELSDNREGKQMIEYIEKAIIDYTEAIRLVPDDAGAYNNRAIEYEKLVNYEKAIFDYAEAIRLEPTSIMYIKNRAFLYKTMEKTSEADLDNARIKELEALNTNPSV